MLAILLQVMILVSVFYYFRFYHPLESRWESRQDFRKNLGNSEFKQNYIEFLSRCLDWLSHKKRLGTPWSWQALKWSFVIAFVYPIAFALSTWWGSDKPLVITEGVMFIPTAIEQSWLLVGILLLFWLFMLNVRNILAFVVRSFGEEAKKVLRSLVPFLVIYGSFGLAALIVFMFNIAGAIIVAFFGAIVFAFGGALAFAGARIYVILAFISMFIIIILMNPVLFFFYLSLPFFNSILDYISLSCSRWLSHRIVKLEHKHWYLAPLHFLVDALLALLFLFGLAALLPLASKLLNAIYRQEVINWLDFAKSAWQDPWGSGFFVTAMLLSTLVPTLIHLFIALAAFCLPKYPDNIRQWLIARLDNPDFANFSHQSIAKEAAVLMAMWAIPFMMFAALCWLLGWALLAIDQSIWHAVYRVAVWADGLF